VAPFAQSQGVSGRTSAITRGGGCPDPPRGLSSRAFGLEGERGGEEKLLEEGKADKRPQFGGSTSASGFGQRVKHLSRDQKKERETLGDRRET